MKALQIIRTAYRATAEEQDDTIVWLCHAMRGAGADIDVLLCGDAVNYAVAAQNGDGLAFGSWRQAHPPQPARDIAQLCEKGVAVFVDEDDVRRRGIADDELIDGPVPVSAADVPELFERYDQVWRW